MKKRCLLSIIIIFALSLSITGGQSVFELFNNGYLHYERAQYDDAAEKFQELMEKFPNTEWAVAAEYYLALCIDDLQEAIGVLSSLVQRHPDSPYGAGARFTLGQYSYILGEYEVARRYLREYIEVSANREKRKNAYHYIFRSYLAEEKHSGFYSNLDEFKEKYPDDIDDMHILWYRFKVSFQSEEYSESVSLGEELINEYPESTYMDRIIYFTALAYEKLRDSTRAQYFRNLLEDTFPHSHYLNDEF